jgi:hypothetical protein
MVYNALRRLGTAFNWCIQAAGSLHHAFLALFAAIISIITPRAPFQAPLYLFMEESAKEGTAQLRFLHVITMQLPR